VRRLAPVLILPGLLLIVLSQPVAAATPSSLAAAQARQAQLNAVRAQLGDAIASNIQTQDQLTQALAENRQQAEALAAQIADANAKVAALDAEIAALDERRSVLQERIATERHQLDLLARALYVQPDSLVMSLAQAGSLHDAMTEIGDLQSASHRAQAIKAQMLVDEAQLEADRKKQDDARRQEATIRDGLQAKSDQLKALQDRQAAALDDLRSKLASSQAELASVNGQSAATAAYITGVIQAEQAEATAAAYQAVWEQVQLLGGQMPAAGDTSFTNPLPGAVKTQGFGPTDLVFEPPYGGYPHFHTGVDLSTTAGTPVLAAAAGTVVLAGFNTGGYGNYVVIAHGGGLDTLYGHLASIAVKPGQQVGKGQPIGTEGSTGNSTGPHLHFEVRHNGLPVDPATYLK
jgi:murein DD-endopeptidase MepM/ murein hydrolase activator NlpD